MCPSAVSASLTTTPTTITLNDDCLTTEAVTIPDGVTLNGGGHTITANDQPRPPETPTPVAVVTNAAGATTMNIENLTVTGPDGGFPFLLPQNSCNSPFPGLFGIYFNDASGSVTNVEVRNIFQTNTAPGSPACGMGHGIRADGVTADRTVTITNTKVSNFQKSGMFASGRVTMNVTGSTIGPPSSVPFSIAQNSVTYTNTSTNSNPAVGAGGTMTGNTIIGGSFSSTGPVDPASNASTAVLLFGSNNVTIDKNQIRGQDLGVSVAAGSTNSVISFNAFTRPTVPTPDSFGIGASVEEGLADTTDLICNTFDGWNTNIEGDLQISCPLPDGAECKAYSATPTVIGAAEEPFAWSLASGKLPPGLSLAPTTGDITGTPPDGSAGTYNFTLQVDTANQLTVTSEQTIKIAPGCATPTPSPSATATAAPTATAQPTAAPTAVDAGLSSTSGDDQQPPSMPMALMLVAAGLVLTVATVVGLRRRPRQH